MAHDICDMKYEICQYIKFVTYICQKNVIATYMYNLLTFVGYMCVTHPL